MVVDVVFASLFTAAASSIRLKCLSDDDNEGEGTGDSVRELLPDFATNY
jgi:hypothetical protein